jgi:hypothetical protein
MNWPRKLRTVVMSNRLQLIAIFHVMILSFAGGCTAQAICEKEKECASDPPGEDYINVCSTRYQGEIDALNANKEDECKDLAVAKTNLDACRAQLDCDDYEESDLGGNCDDELDEFEEAYEDAADIDLDGDATVLLSGPYLGFIPQDCTSLD